MLLFAINVFLVKIKKDEFKLYIGSNTWDFWTLLVLKFIGSYLSFFLFNTNELISLTEQTESYVFPNFFTASIIVDTFKNGEVTWVNIIGSFSSII